MKRKSTELIEDKETTENQNENKEEDNNENKENKKEENKKKSKIKIPGVKEILASEEAKEDMAVVEKVIKKKKLKAIKNPKENTIVENPVNADPSLKLDTAHKNNNNNLNNNQSEKRKLLDRVKLFLILKILHFCKKQIR